MRLAGVLCGGGQIRELSRRAYRFEPCVARGPDFLCSHGVKYPITV